MRKADLTEEKRRAAELLAAGWDKARVAREIGRNRSTLFSWLHEPGFADFLASIKATPQQDEDMAAVRTTAVGVARAQVQRAEQAEDSQGAREALEACAAALRVARDAGSLGGAPAAARPADQEAARLAGEAARRAKALMRRLQKGKANGAAEG